MERRRKVPKVNGRAIESSAPIRDQKDFFKKMESANKEPLRNQSIVRGVLLYTNADEILTRYIQKHFQEFHKLSGDWCKIFILEKPDDKWRAENLSLIEKIKLKCASAVDKTEAFDIARELEIDINQIPCLIFFGKDVNQRLIMPINQEESLKSLSKYFRELFAALEEVINGVSSSTAKSLSSASAFETISYHFDEIINYLDKYAQKRSYQNHYSYQNQTIIAEKLVMEDKSVSKNYNLKDSHFGGGFINADQVNAQCIGSDIGNISD